MPLFVPVIGMSATSRQILGVRCAQRTRRIVMDAERGEVSRPADVLVRVLRENLDIGLAQSGSQAVQQGL